MTPERLVEIKAGHDEYLSYVFDRDPDPNHIVALAIAAADDDVPALIAEVERCWSGMRQLLAERDAARHVLAEIGRYANDPEFSDAFVRGFVQEVTK